MVAHECYIAMLEIDDHLQALNIKEQWVTVEPTETLEDISLDNDRLDRVTHISTQANPLIREELALFLKNNQDIFTWSHKDMSRINPSIMIHWLNVSSSFPPIWQKMRVFAEEKDKAIGEEVRKLLEAGFITEVYYPGWLANVVMVKKANDKWRMCVDFIDLNRACLKDSYPLPWIDPLNSWTPAIELHGRLLPL